MMRGFGLLDTVLWGSLYTCTAFFFFTSLSTFIDSCLVPLHLRISQKKTWKWVNYSVSWCHSTISGALGILSLALAPVLLENVIVGYSELGYIACCVSYGYFFHDTLDMLHNLEEDASNGKLILHHLFVLLSATWVVFTKTYVGWGVIALVIEVHSSVLHSRVLFKMYNGPSSVNSKYYVAIKWLNMATFFVFRFGSLTYLSYTMWRDYNSAPIAAVFWFTCVAVAIIILLSIQLFVQVFMSDFWTTPVAQTDKTFQAIKEGLVPGSSVTTLSAASLDNGVQQHRRINSLTKPPLVQ